MDKTIICSGHIVEEDVELSLAELSRTCGVNAEWLMRLVEEGILDPYENGPRWRFRGLCIQRVRVVQRLQRDLGVNLAGAALALELLEEINTLQARMAALGAGDKE